MLLATIRVEETGAGAKPYGAAAVEVTKAREMARAAVDPEARAMVRAHRAATTMVAALPGQAMAAVHGAVASAFAQVMVAVAVP
jgi:hypothetical protein